VFFHPSGPLAPTGVSFLGSGLGGMITQLVEWIGNGLVLIVLSFALLFGSVLLFRVMITNLLGLRTQERVKQYFFKSSIQSFGWGLLITAAIRSSTVTTSLVVPLVAKKVVKLKGVVPFILGANIGTTITAFIAAMSNSNIAISIALAHFLFNLIGVLIFSLVPYVRSVPVRLAKGLGQLTMKYRLAGFLYILLTFFFIPFSLIYLNKNAASVTELTYKADVADGGSREYRIVCRAFRNQPLITWTIFNGSSADPSEKLSVYRKANVLIINDEVFELNSVGYCRTGEDATGRYDMCILDIRVPFALGRIRADSAYIFQKSYPDSSSQMLYISASDNIVLKRALASPAGKVLESHTLIRMARR
jgi:sodium-dependent phosphate cotransporter